MWFLDLPVGDVDQTLDTENDILENLVSVESFLFNAINNWPLILTVCSNEVESHRNVSFPSVLCPRVPGCNADRWSLDASSVPLGHDHHHPLCLVPRNGWESKENEENSEENTLQEGS